MLYFVANFYISSVLYFVALFCIIFLCFVLFCIQFIVLFCIQFIVLFCIYFCLGNTLTQTQPFGVTLSFDKLDKQINEFYFYARDC